MNKYKYHLIYFVKAFLVYFVGMILIDLVLRHELSVLDTIQEGILFSAFWSVMFLSYTRELIKNLCFNLDELDDMRRVEATIKIRANGIDEIIDKIKEEVSFNKAKFETSNDEIIISR